MVSFRKTTVNIVPVTAQIDGERVVVGETTLVVVPQKPVEDSPDPSQEVPVVPEITSIDLDAPEGLTVEAIKNKGIETALSVRSDRPDLVKKLAEQNKKYKEENTNDGTVGNTDASADYSGS
jgi:hypothetical protein